MQRRRLRWSHLGGLLENVHPFRRLSDGLAKTRSEVEFRRQRLRAHFEAFRPRFRFRRLPGRLRKLLMGEGQNDAARDVPGDLGSIRGYAVPRFVRDDYLASYEGDRLTRSAALVRAYPKDLAALVPRLASIKVPVAIVVGRNDPYGLARDAALLRDRLPHARLDVLEAGHCVWEERVPEFEPIVTQWVSCGFRGETDVIEQGRE
jgi:pimeloyl-ACP methyl ester carboxylesterase